MAVTAFLAQGLLFGTGWAVVAALGSRGSRWPFGFLRMRWWAVALLTWAMTTPGIAMVLFFESRTVVPTAVTNLMGGGIFAILNLFAMFLTKYAPDGGKS